MFGFDSLSRNAFIRKLPKTYSFLKHLNADTLQGYNIIGDGTPQALIPVFSIYITTITLCCDFFNSVIRFFVLLKLLTGYTELELPETRKRISDSGFVNIYPFIFYEYAQYGYVSAFNEDLPDYGTFSYRLNGILIYENENVYLMKLMFFFRTGFQEQPTTHFMRPFYLALQKEISRHKRLCVGDTPRHKVMLEYTHKVLKI